MRRRRLLSVAGALAAQALGPVADAAAPVAERFARNFDGMRLRDQDDRPFDFERLLGQVLLVGFVYTGCSTVCPVQTRALVEVLARLPRQARVRLVSLSVDPRGDTPAVLRAHARQVGADLSRWSFVTGRLEDIERLGERLRLFRPDRAATPADHASGLWCIDAEGRLVQRYAGNPPDVARLVRELPVLAGHAQG